MPELIELSDDLVNSATKHGKACHRSPSQQIEYWAKIGKAAEENPDLPFSFLTDIIVSLAEMESGEMRDV